MKSIIYSIAAFAVTLPSMVISGDWNYCPQVQQQPQACCPTGYVFGYGGVFNEKTVEGNEPIFPSNEIIDMDSGYIVGAGAGIYSCFLGGSRFELEGLFAQNDIGRIRSDIFDGNGFTNFGFRGQLGTRAYMANLFKEIQICEGIVSYVGGGIGLAHTDLKIYDNNNSSTSESDATLAYQFVAGVDFPITDCLALFLQYKALGRGETHYERLDFVIEDYITHHLIVGARLSF